MSLRRQACGTHAKRNTYLPMNRWFGGNHAEQLLVAKSLIVKIPVSPYPGSSFDFCTTSTLYNFFESDSGGPQKIPFPRQIHKNVRKSWIVKIGSYGIIL
jgi:hypothetical protein